MFGGMLGRGSSRGASIRGRPRRDAVDEGVCMSLPQSGKGKLLTGTARLLTAIRGSEILKVRNTRRASGAATFRGPFSFACLLPFEPQLRRLTYIRRVIRCARLGFV